jgi:hypothetical protein
MKIFTSETRSTLDQVDKNISPDKHLATVTETVLDQEFIEQLENDWCWVGNSNTPTETGWYRIDRQNQSLLKASREEAAKLPWHERLFVYQSALAAVQEESHLALYIGGEYYDGRLPALYLCGPDYLAWVAQR